MTKEKLLIQLKQKDLKNLRLKEYNKQKGICCILNKKVDFIDTALDHKHKRKNEKIGENYTGLIRGCISKIANSWEGKVQNSFIRMGLHKHTDIVSALRRLADYLENPPIEPKYIHPSEIKPIKKLQKKCFNELNKKYQQKYPKRKPLMFPKRKIITKKLRRLFNEFNIKIKYLK